MAEVRGRLEPAVTQKIAQDAPQRIRDLRFVRRPAHADQRPHEVEHQVIGERLAVGETAPLDPADRTVGALDVGAQLRQQPRLSHARLTEHARDPCLSGPHHAEYVAQPRELRIAADHRRAKSDETARGLRSGLEAGDLVGLDRVGLSFQLQQTHVDSVDERRDEAIRRRCDEHAASARGRLHPRRDVHRIAHRGVLIRGVAADHADDDRAGVDADPNAKIAGALRALRRPQLVDHARHVQSAAHRTLGVVLVRHRRSEEREDAVAHESRDRPVVVLDRAGHALERLADQRRPVLRIHALGDRGGARDVGEQDRDRTALA